MPFLTLNGVEVKATESSREPVRIGERSRAFSGKARKSERARKREWRCRTGPLEPTEAKALAAFIEGDGHHFSLDADLYSERGLGAASGSAGFPGTAISHNGYATVSGYSGVGAQVTWNVGAFSAWTFVCSLYHRPTTTWRIYEVRSDGAQFVDGVREDSWDRRVTQYNAATGVLDFRSPVLGGSAWSASSARALGAMTNGGGYAFEVTTAGTTGTSEPVWPSASGATVTDGTVVWKNVGGASGVCADLAWMPFMMPDGWAPPVYTFHWAGPWSSLPHLTANGDLLGNVATTVMGEVTGSQTVSFQGASGWVPAGEVLDFTLYEV